MASIIKNSRTGIYRKTSRLPIDRYGFNKLFGTSQGRALRALMARCMGLLVTTLLFSACLNTRLESPAITPRIFKVAADSDRPLALKILPFESDSIGNQYLFLAVPFGKIQVAAADQALTRALYNALALRGYRPLPDSNLGQHSLEIEIEKLQVTAYDLLFVRRIKCQIRLKGRLKNRAGQTLRQVTADAEKVAYKSFAFKPQLEHYYYLTLGLAVKDLIHKLGL